LATRCQILRLKCTKFDFSSGSAQTRSGRLQLALPQTQAGFKGSISKGRKGRKKGRAKKEKKGRGGGKEGRGICLLLNLGLATPLIAMPNLTLVSWHSSRT